MFVVDGGHNPQCAQTVRDNLLNYFPETHRVLLVGMLSDKDWAGTLDILNAVSYTHLGARTRPGVYIQGGNARCNAG